MKLVEISIENGVDDEQHIECLPGVQINVVRYHGAAPLFTEATYSHIINLSIALHGPLPVFPETFLGKCEVFAIKDEVSISEIEPFLRGHSCSLRCSLQGTLIFTVDYGQSIDGNID